MGIYVGFDIGGTKCAAVTGIEKDGELTILGREAFATPADQQEALDRLCALAEKLAGGQEILGIGISSGGPMDADKGELCNPPNLPGWHGISLTDCAQQKLHAPALLENDANACALAEWRWGAGKGSKVMMFLTFGTGLGAGIVIGGRVLRGANGNAGELGHWRLAETGPAGYGKVGAFEGFCSGGGILQLSGGASAREVVQRADAGDAAMQSVLSESAEKLGMCLSLLIDLLNPERIIIGSIFARAERWYREKAQRVIDREALTYSSAVCRILPAALGDALGDYAALSVGVNGLK